jgi:competence protein ComEA
MDFSELRERFSPIFIKYWIPILLGVAGFVFLLYGLIGSVSHKNSSSDILSEGASDVAETSNLAGAKTKTTEITLDVEGAVIHPGIYQLGKDARIQDALIAAGGLSDKADREKVAKGLNLATKVIDGGKIYIPFVGDTAAVAGGSSSVSSGSTDSTTMTADSNSGLININTATSEQLDSLPGVGTVTAAKIINNRPYGSIDELLSKKSVGASVFAKIKDKISI